MSGMHADPCVCICVCLCVYVYVCIWFVSICTKIINSHAPYVSGQVIADMDGTGRA